jgi:hypothetical protein
MAQSRNKSSRRASDRQLAEIDEGVHEYHEARALWRRSQRCGMTDKSYRPLLAMNPPASSKQTHQVKQSAEPRIVQPLPAVLLH